jgi:hypothetical protein
MYAIKTTLMNIYLMIFCLLLVTIGIATALYKRRKQALISEKKEAYLAALRNGNKPEALRAGREYYKELRGGKLIFLDDQAIANNLSSM